VYGVYEWRVTVLCPVRGDKADDLESDGDVERRLYVWTDNPSDVDAYWEVLRVLEGWPADTKILEVTQLGRYVPADTPPDAPR
jgi:hypothetical protein